MNGRGPIKFIPARSSEERAGEWVGRRNPRWGVAKLIIDNRAGRTCENRAAITIFEGRSGPDRPDNQAPVLPLHLDVSIVVQAGRIVQAERNKILKQASY